MRKRCTRPSHTSAWWSSRPRAVSASPSPTPGADCVLAHRLDARRSQPLGEVDQLRDEARRRRVLPCVACVGRHQRVLCAARKRAGLDRCAVPVPARARNCRRRRAQAERASRLSALVLGITRTALRPRSSARALDPLQQPRRQGRTAADPVRKRAQRCVAEPGLRLDAVDRVARRCRAASAATRRAAAWRSRAMVCGSGGSSSARGQSSSRRVKSSMTISSRTAALRRVIEAALAVGRRAPHRARPQPRRPARVRRSNTAAAACARPRRRRVHA